VAKFPQGRVKMDQFDKEGHRHGKHDTRLQLV